MENSNILNTTGKNLVLIFVIGIILSYIVMFTQGDEPLFFFYRLGTWITTLALALFVNFLTEKAKVITSKKIGHYPYLLFIPDIINIFNNSISDLLFGFANTYYVITALIYYGINIFVLYKLYTFLKQKNILAETNGDNESDFVEDKQKTILGSVILTIKERAKSSNKRVFFSLIIMVIIVLVGSTASFGTLALNEANKIRELEAERIKMEKIADGLKRINNENFDKKFDEIKELLSNKYGNEKNYKELITNIEEQSYISWPDIAMRITIAALTLFLVQIFFHIYKYNQRQESELLNKMETFRLFTDEKADLNSLRNGLLSKMNSNIDFEKTPQSPTEQIINIIGKTKE